MREPRPVVGPINLTFVVPDALRWDDELVKSFQDCAPYYFGGISPSVSGRTIALSGIPARSLEQDPRDILDRLIRDLVRGFRDTTERQLLEHKSSRVYVANAFDQLLASRSLVESAPGQFSYHGEFLAVMDGLDRLIAAFAREVGAVEERYPATVPASLLRRSGYLKSFPHQALFVAPIRHDRGAIERVQRQDDEAGNLDSSDLASPAGVLAPTVCYHTFNARKDRNDQTPETLTALNMCHRFESSNVRSLERLSTFHMREIVYFGTPERIAAELERCVTWFLELLQAWDVSFRATTANDPFFATSSDGKRMFQAAFALKREVRLYIPASDRWISVASFNNHSDSLVGSFAISADDGSKMASGCVGFGYERLLYGLYCALGLDITAWPAAFRQAGLYAHSSDRGRPFQAMVGAGST